jgi:hypothetical protein
LGLFVGEFADNNVTVDHRHDNTTGHRRRGSVRDQDVAMPDTALVQGVTANPDRVATGATKIENRR